MADDEDLESLLAAQLAEHAQETVSVGIPATAEPKPPVEVLADPRLMKLIEQRFRPDVARQHELPRWAGELPFHLDPATWRTGFVSIVEGGPPLSIREGLLENVPQANLRDLFRPEWSEAPVALELHALPLDPGGRQAFAEIRRNVQREPLPRIERLAAAIDRLELERKAFLAQPWKPFLADDQPRRPAFVMIEPASNG